MLATVKISPTFKDYFNDLEYQVDASSLYDIESYLSAMHPKFKTYITQIKNGSSQENISYLNSDLQIIEKQNYPFKKIKDGEVIYVAPLVCGGGGKKGMIIAMVAFVAIGIATGGFSLMGAPGMGMEATMAAGHVGGGTFAASGGGFLSSMGAAFAGLPSFVQGMLGNLALSALGALFASKPPSQDVQVTKDSGTRTENNMFGSLKNTSTAGTPILLNYGLFRIGGQFLSGYILSQQHAQDSAPSVQSIFNANQTPLAAEAVAAE